jgi:hypothetical protein
MKILFRISDGGNNKVKPTFVYNKQLMLIHLLKVFKKHDIYVFADNVSDETFNLIVSLHSNVTRTSLGNAGSFMRLIDFAISNFNDDEKVYLAEDDYIYKMGSAEIIEEGLNIANYVSGYDHPDKYINYNEGGPNPFIEKGGELTRVLMTEHSHWKITNSCCLTFGTTVRQLKKDYAIFLRHGTGDFGMFCDIYKSDPDVRLISPIPSLSTHGETAYLAKFVNWELEFMKSFNH